MEVLETASGFCLLEISGHNSFSIFANEAGGHRWQRVPPTERHGRVHTSTITVAVFGSTSDKPVQIKAQDIRICASRGSGPGGQHRNKTSTAIQITHLPTNTSVRCDTMRSQLQNKEKAMEILLIRLSTAAKTIASQTQNHERQTQVGSGMRGDKRRTIACQRGRVSDHVDQWECSLDKYLIGKWKN
jgi:peptide chain release factor 1